MDAVSRPTDLNDLPDDVLQNIAGFGLTRQFVATCRRAADYSNHHNDVLGRQILSIDRLADLMDSAGLGAMYHEFHRNLVDDKESPAYNLPQKTKAFVRNLFGRDVPEFVTIQEVHHALINRNASAAEVKLYIQAIRRSNNRQDHEIEPDFFAEITDENAEDKFVEWFRDHYKGQTNVFLHVTDPNIRRIPRGAADALFGVRGIFFRDCSNLLCLPNDFVCPQRLSRGPNFSGCSSLQSLHPSFYEPIVSDGASFSGCFSLRVQNPSLKFLFKCSEAYVSYTKRERTTSLDLSGFRHFGSLPGQIMQLVNLEALNLTDWRSLKTLPESLSRLPNLRVLNLTGCDNIVIPQSVIDMASSGRLQIVLPDGEEIAMQEDVGGGGNDAVALDVARPATPEPAVQEVVRAAPPRAPDQPDPISPVVQLPPTLLDTAALQQAPIPGTAILGNITPVAPVMPDNVVEAVALPFISTENAFRLAVTSPKSPLFSQVDPESLPPALRSEIGRVILCWVLRIFTLGFIELAKHFLPLPERIIENRTA